jgi:hypothetical protein
MKNLKTISVIIFIMAAFACCKKEKTPLETLPAATQTGANTFGYLVDGEAVILNGKFHTDALNCYSGVGIYNSTSEFDIYAKVCEDKYLYLHVSKPLGTIGTFNLVKAKTGTDCYANLTYQIGAIHYQTTDSLIGKLVITKASDHILAGTFEFNCLNTDINIGTHTITNGRFDISF